MGIPYIDAHCHLATSTGDAKDASLAYYSCHGSFRCVMSTNPSDWKKLQTIENADIIKGFGVHPWYSHLFNLGDDPVDKIHHYESVLECNGADELLDIIQRLPEPIPLERYIREQYSSAQVGVIGEIGLDKLFRLPINGFYVQTDEPFRLTRVRVKMSHQIAIFKRFCQLAAQFDKPVSLHDVKCHGKVFQICQDELLPNDRVNICLHSFTGSLDTVTHQWLKAFPSRRVFFSLSKFINFKSQEKGITLARGLPNECILTETDFPIDGARDVELTNQLDYVCQQLRDALGLASLEESKNLVHSNFKNYLHI